MKPCFTFTSFIVALGFSALAVAENLSIELSLSPQLTSKQGDTVMLSQAVSIYNDQNLLLPLNALMAHTAVPAAYLADKTLTKDEVREILLNNHLADNADIKIYGDKAVIKYINKQLIDPETIKQVASKYLQETLDKSITGSEIECISTIKPVSFAGANVKLEPHWLKKPLPSAREKVTVDIISEKGSRQSVILWFSVAIEKNVLIANQDISAHVRLKPELFTVTKKDITGLYALPVNLESISEKNISNGLIRSGDVITEHNIQAAPDVVNGEIVYVESRAGDVKISASAIAAADGLVGQSIPLRSLSTHELYYGYVKGEKSIVVGANNENM